MIDTLKMWLLGLPYALWETQRRKVAVDRFMAREAHGFWYKVPPLTEWGNEPADLGASVICEFVPLYHIPLKHRTWN